MTDGAMMTCVATLRERFEAKYSIVDSGCWEWTATTTRGGYGQIRRGKLSEGWILAHRASHEMFIGPIPEGFEVDHLCHNPGCVNPAHLEAVTKQENMRRSRPATKTHCKRGHEFSPENTEDVSRWPSQNSARRCKQCQRDNMSRRWAEGKIKPKTETQKQRDRARSLARYYEKKAERRGHAL